MPKRLTAAAVRAAKPGPKGKPDRRIPDGDGLILCVKPTGAKSWLLRTSINGERTNRGLGPVSQVTLAEARLRAAELRRTILNGNAKPIVKRGCDAPRAPGIPTFAEALDAITAREESGWKAGGRSAEQWRRSLEQHAPALVRRPVSDIDQDDVLAALRPIWVAKHPTAKRVRRRISTIMAWAIAKRYRADDPAGPALDFLLPKIAKKEQKRHAAAPHAAVGPMMARLRASDAGLANARLAVEFLVLTAARSGEVRGATWGEFDRAARTWSIPGARMKAGADHRVPLTARAMEILDAAEANGGASGLVFKGARDGKPLTDATLRNALDRVSDGSKFTIHGFRSSFTDWADEKTDAPASVRKFALAHKNTDSTDAAYARSDLFDRRRVLMDEWAAYLGAAE